MKIVLDSNVIIAAFAARGLCHEIFETCIYEHQVVVCKQILMEVKRSLQKKIKVPASVIKDIEHYLKTHTIVSKAPKLAQAVCRDKDDDSILSVAGYNHVDYIVSGDKDLLVLKSFQEIPILSPRDFWQQIHC